MATVRCPQLCLVAAELTTGLHHRLDCTGAGRSWGTAEVPPSAFSVLAAARWATEPLQMARDIAFGAYGQ